MIEYLLLVLTESIINDDNISNFRKSQILEKTKIY